MGLLYRSCDELFCSAKYSANSQIFPILVCVSYVIMIGLNLDSSVRIPAWLEIPLMLYWFWSAFYIFMFAARMLKSVTEGELVNRSDSFGTFLYLIFIPWGMWSIQKQIHLILANQAITMS
jgi:hypothetical protein